MDFKQKDKAIENMMREFYHMRADENLTGTQKAEVAAEMSIKMEELSEEVHPELEDKRRPSSQERYLSRASQDGLKDMREMSQNNGNMSGQGLSVWQKGLKRLGIGVNWAKRWQHE